MASSFALLSRLPTRSFGSQRLSLLCSGPSSKVSRSISVSVNSNHSHPMREPCQLHQNPLQIRHKHTVRIILTRDLPEGQKRGMYAGEVHNVAAGYARNYLIPKKMAVYATPKNFERCGLADPALLEGEIQRVSDEEGGEDLKAADLLRRYLKNKKVKITRNVDPNMPSLTHPGHVSADHLRAKLSKQLKIDLEPHETIHIRADPVVEIDNLDEKEQMQLILTMDEDNKSAGESKIIEKDVSVENVEIEANVDASDDEGINAKVEGANGEEADNSVEDKEKEIEIAATAEKSGKIDVAADANISSNESDVSTGKECNVKINHLGDYIAKITLRGGYIVPLKFEVVKR